MRTYLTVFALLISSALPGCASFPKVQLPESAEMQEAKSALNKVADKLDARLEVAKGAFAMADNGLMFACNLGMSGDVCTKARKVAEFTEGLIKGADDAIDHYRETGTGFDAAMKKLEDLERRVGELRSLVESLKRGIASGEEPDGGVIGEAA